MRNGAFGKGSREAHSKTRPGLVLMDIQLADGTAFDILDKLGNIDFQLIFITAYNQFAIKAIKAGAFDYLLKPIDEAELNTALERVAKLHNRFDAGTVQQQLQAAQRFSVSAGPDLEQTFCVPGVDYLQFIKMGDINLLQLRGVLHRNPPYKREKNNGYKNIEILRRIVARAMVYPRSPVAYCK